MERIFLLAAVGAVSAILAGCASAPKVEVRGALPVSGTFCMAESGGAPSEQQRTVRDRLVSAGLAERGHGTYLVQTALSAPGRSVRLNVTMTQIASGSEVLRATSSRRNARLDARTIGQLVDAVFAQLMRGAWGKSVAAPA